MSIIDKEQKIRNFINNPRKRKSLLSVKADWNRLCSSLDVIGDTELAISAYPIICNKPDNGSTYIIVYGMLQALLTQQDAVKHIYRVLNIKYSLPKELQEIRIIRNNAIGHPVHEKENGVSKSSFIARYSLSPSGFELMTAYSDSHGYQSRSISIPKLINVQHEYIGNIMDDILNELESEEMKHRNSHKDRKVRNAFPQQLTYYFGKVFEACSGVQAHRFGLIHLNFIEESLRDFEGELKKRNEWGVYDSIGYHMELIQYPLTELKAYFTDKDNSKLNNKDAYIFTIFISEQIDTLKKIAEEIDEEYASEIQG